MDYLKAACKRLNVDPKRVINSRVQGDEFVLIVDNGIDGCPKYVVPLAGLETGEPVAGATDLPDDLSVAGPEVESVTVSVEEEEPPEEINATDSALALATEHDIDLAGVQGSGAGGRIIKRDVEALL